MFRSAATASFTLGLFLLTGCSSSPGRSTAGAASASFDEMTPTQIAAWSATSKYPTTTPLKMMDVTVIVNQSKNTIKVYNLSGTPLRNSKLWVNKTFVAKVDAVAPQTNLVINTERLYDGVGNVFSKQQREVTTVQLQTEDGLYDLLGPVAE